MAQRLTDAEQAWRNNLGARIGQAAKNAELSITEVAQLIGDPASQVSRYIQGLRKVHPVKLAAIARVTGVAVEDLIGDGPLPPPKRTGRCREQFVIEVSDRHYRAITLLTCDKPAHSERQAHHDPGGFTWKADQATVLDTTG